MNLRVCALLSVLSVVIGFASLSAQGQHPDTCLIIYDASGTIIAFVDSGLCDTVRIGCPLEYSSAELADLIGDSIAIPVYVWSDQRIGGFSFGFSYNSNTVEITSFDMTGSVAPASWLFPATFRPAENRVLVGGIDLCLPECSEIPPTPGETALLLFKLNMRILPGAGPQVIDLDSTFVMPAGYFILAALSSRLPNEIPPQYVDCGVHDIILGTSEPLCGDVNGSGEVNLTDVVCLIQFIFGGGPAPAPLATGDANCNGIVNITDVVYLIQYIFSGGPEPCALCK